MDYSSHEPRFVQLARIIRERAIRGEWEIGARVPSENDLVSEFGINRETARSAMRLLEEEGMIAIRRGHGSYLVALPIRREVALRQADSVIVRMPTGDERRELGLALGIPLMVVVRADGREEKHGAAALIARVICE